MLAPPCMYPHVLAPQHLPASPSAAGLLRGLYTVSSDGCLYAETFAINLARRKTATKAWGDEARQWAWGRAGTRAGLRASGQRQQACSSTGCAGHGPQPAPPASCCQPAC